MREEPGKLVEPAGRADRRTWLASVLAAVVAAAHGALAGDEPGHDEDEEVRGVEALAKRAGLRPFRASRSRHYLALGDAPEGFRELTLQDCELIAADYLDYYKARGFDVALPDRRLIVVALADDRSFAAFLGDKTLAMVPRNGPIIARHGVYLKTPNRLVVFDHRNLGPQLAPRAGYENLRTLAHEATHQLTFNTGLLNLRGDVPASIVEGLGMYSEVRKPSGRTPPGGLNLMRLQDLAHLQRQKVAWIPVEELLAEDRFIKHPANPTELLFAYAESWLFVDYLLKERTRLPGFRAYLAAIRDRLDPGSRLHDARKHLGDLGRLNQDLRGYSVRLLKGA
jgi:hypothetical protein